MRDFFEQVARGGEGYYYLALSGALIIPDLCGAMEAQDGQANGQRYRTWFDAHVAPFYEFPPGGEPIFTGEDCWMLRCSFLHQGTTQHPRSSYSRILFTEPNPREIVLHMNVTNDALNISVREFCQEMAGAALNWLESVKDTAVFKQNFSQSLQRYPDGFPPYIVGLTVIT